MEDRRELIAAFLPKSIYKLARRATPLTMLPAQRPGNFSESAFSRAFADFARRRLPELIHETRMRRTQPGRIIGHIAREATAIEAHECFPETYRQKCDRDRQKAAKPLL